jgi:uncharacterized membrane protein
MIRLTVSSLECIGSSGILSLAFSVHILYYFGYERICKHMSCLVALSLKYYLTLQILSTQTEPVGAELIHTTDRQIW